MSPLLWTLALLGLAFTLVLVWALCRMAGLGEQQMEREAEWPETD